MFGLRVPELLIILFVALLIFGPRNLPKLGKMAGDALGKTRKLADGFEYDEDEDTTETDKDA